MNPERLCYGCFQEKEPGAICPHCGFDENEEQPYLALPLGTLLNGRYMLGKVLGVGGFGITYLGFDLTLEIKVAIKEYMPSSIATRGADRYNVTHAGQSDGDYQYGMDRFLDEAKILAKLQNTPHIVSVQNYFQENNTAYFVMEYIDGMSLKAYLATQGERIPYTQALTILEPIMEALIQVHAMNLLHRDISPDNIFLTAQGDSRLLDFGAARFSLGDGKSVSVILKHGYAPEEQYSSHGNQGPWTDVYAMGATLYRCITGQLPPDSVERIRGDTLQPPSALGVRLPQHVEQAILKALAVKTEDRFSNMGAFLRALTGRVSVQEQVAASVSERTQASAYGQTVYAGHSAAAQKSAASAGLLAFFKANPVIAWVAGIGLAAVLALCIALPIALSGSGNAAPAGSSGSSGVTAESPPTVSVPDETPDTGENPSDPSESLDPSDSTDADTTPAALELEARDLGALNASIDVPTDYVVSADGFSFVNEDRGCAITTSFVWNLVVPIYSLADVEENQEAIVASLMTGFDVTDFTILSAGSERIGGRAAYQISFEGTDTDGVTMDLIYLAVQGDNPFGCYGLLGAYPLDDEAGRAEVLEILQSFQCLGTPDTTYGMWYSDTIGMKFIIDDALALGSVWELEIELNSGTAHAIAIYPTEAAKEAGLGNLDSEDAGGVEVGFVSEYGFTKPEELLDDSAASVAASGGTAGERYTAVMGGAEWLCQNYTIDTYYFSSASAVIDGQCFYLSAMYSASNQEAVVALCNQVMASVRPW